MDIEKAIAARKAQSELNKKKKHTTLRQAVKAHCKACIYDEHNGGTWLDQVTKCTCKDCDLYEWRPMKKGVA
jgi:hypothetical protein